MKQISKLHFITTSAELAEQACKGGVDWIQLRLKNVNYEEYKAEALKVQAVCKKYGATFIINDNARLALDIKADGVHIGKEDMRPDEARSMLGPEYIIGCTANTYEDIISVIATPINYIGLGPYRFTTTKENLSPVLGEHGYQFIIDKLIANAIAVPPIIAIGGISFLSISPLMQTGVQGIAVSGAIANAGDIALESSVFVSVIEGIANPLTSASGKSSTVSNLEKFTWGLFPIALISINLYFQ